jgi:hypothetical protein
MPSICRPLNSAERGGRDNRPTLATPLYGKQLQRVLLKSKLSILRHEDPLNSSIVTACIFKI